MQVIFLIFLFIIGACLGSFLCCQARRLRHRETHKKDKSLGRHSVCLSCKTKLKWYDNIPIISWLILKGKCRKCGKKIGSLEILSEIGVGLALLLVGVGFMTKGITLETLPSLPLIKYFSLLALFLLVLSFAFLAIYDGAYGELPSFFLFFSIVLAIAYYLLEEWGQPSLDPLFSVLILGGLYLLLYLVSKGKWVGDGDWLLGVAIGLALGKPWLSLLVLFLSNALACLIMIPLTKGNRKIKIHFGPFLIIAFIITFSFSHFFISMI